MKRKKNKILIYLLILVLLFFNITAISFAKYLNSILINGASDIAKYDVKFSSTDSDTKEFDLDSTNYFGNYKFNIVSNSETSLNYDIVLSSLPNDLNVSLDNKTFKTSNNGKVEFKNAGTIKGSTTEQTSTNTLYFTYLKDKDAFNNKIKIDINFNQDKPIKEANSIIKSAYAKYISSLSKEIEIKIPVAEVTYEDWFVTREDEPKVLIHTQKATKKVGSTASRDDITSSNERKSVNYTRYYWYTGKGTDDIVVSKDKQKNVLKRYCGGNMDLNLMTPRNAKKYANEFSCFDWTKDPEYVYLSYIMSEDIDIGTDSYKNTCDLGDFTHFFYEDQIKISNIKIKPGFSFDIYDEARDNKILKPNENGEYITTFYEQPKFSTNSSDYKMQRIIIRTKFIEYNISYDLDGGTTTDDLKKTYTIDDKEIVLPTNVTKDHYIFKGWQDTSTGKMVTSIPAHSTGNKNLKAIFEKEQFTISYVGEDILKTNEVQTYGCGNFSNDGDGTYYCEENKSDDMQCGYSINANYQDGHRYLLDYKVQKVTGTFNRIGGHATNISNYTFKIDNKVITQYQEGGYDNSYTNPIEHNIPDDTNVHHIEFSFDYDGSKESNWHQIFIQPNRNVAGYYLGSKFKIFDIHLIDLFDTQDKVYNEEVGTLPTPTPKTGYTFDGWYTEKNGKGTHITDKTKISSSMILYPYYKPITYTITYDLNGGKETTTLKKTYTVEDEDYLIPSATYEGLGFEMWINEQTNQRLDKIEKGSTGDLFLKANYSKELVPVYCETWYADFNKNPLSFSSTSPVIKYFAPGATVSGEEWNDEIQYLRYLKSTSIIVDKKKRNVVYRLFWENHFASSFGRSGASRVSKLMANVDFVDKNGKVIKQMENWEITQDGWKVSTKELGDWWFPCGFKTKKVFNVTSNNPDFKVFAYDDPGGAVVIDDNPTSFYINPIRRVRVWDQGKFKMIDFYDKNIYGGVLDIYFDVTKPNENTVTMKDWDMHSLPIYTKIKFNRLEYDKEKYVILNGSSGYQFGPLSYLLQNRLKQNLSWNETLSLEQKITSNTIQFGQNAYAVRFNPNGAMLDKDKDTVQGTMQNEFIPNYGADSDRKITKNTYKDDYRIFLGWSRDKNAKVPEFTDEAILPKNLFKPCSVGDLYAVWGEKTSAKQNAFSSEEEENEIDNSSLNKDAEAKENITETNETNTSKLEDDTLEDVSKENNSISNENTIKEEDTNITLDNTVEEDTKNIIKENKISDNNISNEVKPNEIAENIIKDVNISSNETSKENVLE